MGDRTWVRLTFPAALKDKAMPIIEEEDGQGHVEDERNGLITVQFEEVNYGNMDCLLPLKKAGIAHDSNWGNGSEYGSGTEHCRFTPEGEAIVKNVFDSEDGKISYYRLLEVIDDHAKLKELILAAQEEDSVLPWDNQVEYGKIFLTRQLIAPSE